MQPKVMRFDVGRMDGAILDPNGFLRASAYATRIGVFAYKTPDGGVRREARLPEDVFDSASMQSLATVPMTDDHPPVPKLNSNNARKYQRGHTGENLLRDGDYIKTPVVITDEELIAKIMNGKHEVSCGYECWHEESPGVYDGQPYDVIQRGIIYNHLAIVDKGRAGPQARLRLDAADAEMVDPTNEESTMEMVTITVEGKEYSVPKEVADYIAKVEAADPEGEVMVEDAKKAATEAEDKAKAMEAEKATAVAEKDKAQAKADSLEEENKKLRAKGDAAEINERVKKRVQLLTVGASLLPAEKASKLDSMSDGEIRREIILAQSPTAELKDKSEIYLESRLDAIVDFHKDAGRTFSTFGSSIVSARKDGVHTDSEKNRQEAIKRSQEAWKQPVGVTKDSK